MTVKRIIKDVADKVISSTSFHKNPRIIAVSGFRQLEQLSETQGRVIDPSTGYVGPVNQIASIAKHGYWTPIPGAERFVGQPEDFEIISEPGEILGTVKIHLTEPVSAVRAGMNGTRVVPRPGQPGDDAKNRHSRRKTKETKHD